MNRVIVHSDINHCYAQLEEMRHPALRRVPMAVGGSAEKRHGIILAKNDLAKAAGVVTGESLNEARRKCPDLLIVRPDYEVYMDCTEQIKAVYRRYTDRVESFGLDEAWFDLTGTRRLNGDPVALANRIQKEVYQRFGIRVSMGISWNKVFAKLGSDLDKNMGFTVITPENYRRLVWPLPLEKLIMIGRHTQIKLNAMGLFTIGDLALTDGVAVARRLGKNGTMLWRCARGFDASPVLRSGYEEMPKSVGNSKTLVHDVTTLEQLHQVCRILCESTAARLRAGRLRGRVVSLALRGTNLRWKGSRQLRLPQPTDLAADLYSAVQALIARQQLQHISLRSVGVQVTDLVADCGFDQPGLFSDPDSRQRQRSLEKAVSEIRSRYGSDKCRMASLETDPELTDFDPLGRLHQVHPVGFLRGPSRG
ncbi:DNA polymerase IV [uncultured Faecalibaculum sp.]|uniref:Y-family DNA polymerase n=1 Tax=uncultured Faecalibaculum sp. TaxID=1729681 RepID=UPI0026035C08|nr:DNA polymerase IV [uncultured Faecalibaculum sp.]